MHRRISISKAGIVIVSMLLIGWAVNAMEITIPEEWKKQVRKNIGSGAQDLFLPGLTYLGKQKWNMKEFVKQSTAQMMPLGSFVGGAAVYETEIEDEETYQKILEQQAKDENEVDEQGKLVEHEKVMLPDVPETGGPSIDTSIEALRNFDYLLGNFYTVDRTTMIGPEQLNADDLLGRNMKLTGTGEGPKVLIFHTHSQETFVDSIPGDSGTSIVGVGQYLTELLNAKGISAIHHDGIYDLINGKLDRSSAYEFAEEGVRSILAQYPTIEVVIDLHRDGVRETTHLVTDINGKQTAQIMFFNGLSRTREKGDISYLPNPYIQDNLAFSLQMQLAGEQMYPGFTRKIYLKSYRYSLHMMPKSLLIEAGAQTNTVEEMRNAMEVLASMLHKVLAP